MPSWFQFRRRSAPKEARPRIVLHVGRNKAGSTTIQDFCLAARGTLLERGVNYALFGHLKDSQPGVPGYGTFEELRDAAFRDLSSVHLVSNEFMFCWPTEYTVGAGRVLADCDCRIFFYLRPYDLWAPSLYTEETKRGLNVRPVDEYLTHYSQPLSCWMQLQEWANAFGWQRIYVQTLDPASLAGGSLLTDFVQALGLAPIDVPVPNSNRSPHWGVVELARCLADPGRDTEWQGAEREAVEPLFDAMAASASGPDAVYLTLQRRRELVTLYNADLDRIRASGGPKLPKAPMPTGPDRPWVPDFGHLPLETRREFFATVLSGDFAARYPVAHDRALALKQRFGGC